MQERTDNTESVRMETVDHDEDTVHSGIQAVQCTHGPLLTHSDSEPLTYLLCQLPAHAVTQKGSFFILSTLIFSFFI